MASNETNLVLILAFLGWLYTRENENYDLDPDDPIPTKKKRKSDPSFIKNMKQEIRKEGKKAEENKEAEYEVRLREGQQGSVGGGGWSGYSSMKQYIDTRLFGQWEYYQDEYQGNIRD